MQSCLETIPDHTRRVFVAFSGGLDSSVLLHLLVTEQREFEVIPWHINHGLVDAAGQMEQFCVAQAQHYGLEIRVDRLDLGGLDSNIEAEARRQRYRLFEQHAGTGDCVLTAHHADDQAETFLLNAFRGSGSAGLRGIASQRKLGQALLLRPLLKYNRARLEDYASQHEIAWFNDPSNRSNRFDRNFLRNQVMPLLNARWPSLRESLVTSSEIQSETQELLDEIAAADLEVLRAPDYAGNATLDASGLLQLSTGRCANLVRYWVRRAGLAAIPHARLQELMQQLDARAAAMPQIAMPDYSIRRYDRRLFLVPDDNILRIDGSFEFGLKLEIAIEHLRLRSTRALILKRLHIEDRGQALTLTFRRNLKPNSSRHRLKRLFQKHRIPPWERDAVPLVYLDDSLEGLLYGEE